MNLDLSREFTEIVLIFIYSYFKYLIIKMLPQMFVYIVFEILDF